MPMMLDSLRVIIIQSKSVDNVFQSSTSDDYKLGTFYSPIPKQYDEVLIILTSFDTLLNVQTFYQRMSNHSYFGNYQMEIGSNISPDPGMYTIYYTPVEYENNMDDEDASIGIQDDDHMIDVIYEGTLS